MMRIAVASQNFRTVTAHAGKTRRFLIFEASPGCPAREVARLDLPKAMSIHEFHGDGPHPLDAVEAVIAGSAGAGFVRRMAARGVLAVTTEETVPAEAAADLASGNLRPATPHRHDDHDEAGGCEGCS
ncbi:nitrogen fixation protein [Rhodobacter sp. Har01]|uniref:NifB/NifX family molybdenum-iron cluster-binding protein n=1 Tax=Rhodobacter sp. Har01 TaxID=2883999 RepID=UPI001D05C4E4|nr:NifB/NifX family molybdenum-iron cluster-binding protein [Rhodobacter sp. Har01]MCB6178557.1 nitrogen fixation protein [Rhodobacter sp. Har01]